MLSSSSEMETLMTAPTTPLKAVTYEPESDERSFWDKVDDKRVVAITRASQVKSIRQRYAKTNEYPLDVVSLIVATAGVGKSTYVTNDLAAASRGELRGEYMGTPVNVALTALEDGKSLQKARLQAHGADLDRVLFLDVANQVAGENLEDRPAFPDDLPAIRSALIENDVKIWVLDPLSSAIPGDTNRRDDVRRALDPLHALARELGISVIGILHLAKGGGKAGEKISGSHALRDIARSVLLIAQDEETGERIVSLDKSNYSSAAGSSWKFGLQDTEVVTDDGEVMSVAKVIELGASDVSVQDLLNRSSEGSEGDHDERNAAQAFIVDFLEATEILEAPAGDVLKAGRAAGFDEKSLKNARSRCRDPRIESRKSGFGAGWVWGVVHDEGLTKDSKDSRPQNVSSSSPSVSPSPSMLPVPGPERASEIRNARGVASEDTPLDIFEEQL